MNWLELVILSVGLAMDAVAVAVGLGLCLPKARFKNAVIIGGYFGVFQAAMPLAGFFMGRWFVGHVAAFGHWIAFGVLMFLGGKMIFSRGESAKTASLAVRVMLPLAIATSIDAMAVGVSLAFLYVDIFFAAAIIGVLTFLLSGAAVLLGGLLGEKFKARAAIVGGLILIAIAVNTLLGG